MAESQSIRPPKVDVPPGLTAERALVKKLPLPRQSRDLSVSTERLKRMVIDVAASAPDLDGPKFYATKVLRKEQAAQRTSQQKAAYAQNRAAARRAKQNEQAGPRQQPRIPVMEMSFDDRLREERHARRAGKGGSESVGTRVMKGFMAGVLQARGQASGDPAGPGELPIRQDISPATEVDDAGRRHQLVQLNGDDQLRLQGGNARVPCDLGA